ncbi:thioredoxin family protein [Gudongella sp. DL1XJH-153]|uniref:thioredoxin family protein n=1 Tax=Gudongella sp. DL1XJH-153 TaxID=3409804 RepID=UPI003BB580F4
MNTEKVVYLNSDEELDEFSKKETHILYFSSENCNVCHSVFPKLVELTSEYDVEIGRIDVNKNVKIAGQHLIFSIPTILIFNEGKEVVRESRFVDFEKISRTLQLILT